MIQLPFTEQDITFYLTVYKDFRRAVWCLDNVRLTYPEARIVIDVDGDHDKNWMRLREMHQG